MLNPFKSKANMNNYANYIYSTEYSCDNIRKVMTQI